MFGVELRPAVYRVESIESPANGYVFGTVRCTGAVPNLVLDARSGAKGDRYPVEDPQEWLSRLVNAENTPQGASAFLLENGVVDVDAIMRDIKLLPKGVRAFWKRSAGTGATPFAININGFLHAKEKAQTRLALTDRARQKDMAGMIARSELIGALINDGLKKIGIHIFEDTNANLIAYVDPRTMSEAIDLCILDYYAKPDIAECKTCKNLFRRMKAKKVFCSTRCKNLYHVREYRKSQVPTTR